MPNDITPPAPTAQQVVESSRKHEGRHEPSFGQDDVWKLNKNYHELADFLGLNEKDRLDTDIAQKVSFIRDVVGDENIDELDAMVKIRDMIRSIGTQLKGKELVKTIYKYSRLQQEREKLDKEISLVVDSPATNVTK